jgi:hypothetical protein
MRILTNLFVFVPFDCEDRYVCLEDVKDVCLIALYR